MNRVILMGRLTRDPEIYYTQGNEPKRVAKYTLAVDRRTRKNDSEDQTADFIRCVCFGRTAEFSEKYLHQGTKMIVEGRIQTGSYTNKDGQKVYTTDVVVENQEFAESKKNESQGSSQASTGSNNQNGDEIDITDDFMSIADGVEDEGLPFC